MLKHTRYKLEPNSLKRRNKNDICKKDTNKLLQLRQNWYKNSRMRCLHWERNVTLSKMSKWKWERLSTISFYKDTKMSRKNSKINKIWRKLDLRRLLKDHGLLQEAKFQLIEAHLGREDQECKHHKNQLQSLQTLDGNNFSFFRYIVLKI